MLQIKLGFSTRLSRSKKRLLTATMASMAFAYVALPSNCSVICSQVIASAFEDEGKLEHTKDSLDKVKELVEEKKAVLVDVRSQVEWDAGHIEGAIFLPIRDLEDKLDEDAVRKKLPEDVIVYTYCAVGFRSLKAGKILAKYKFDVRPLKPGYDELVKAGFPSEKK